MYVSILYIEIATKQQNLKHLLRIRFSLLLLLLFLLLYTLLYIYVHVSENVLRHQKNNTVNATIT